MEIGLSLAGGGIKGAAHIGVLKALEEEKIEINYITGTSSGSIVATLSACGFSALEIYQIFKKYAKKIKYIEPLTILKGLGKTILKGKFRIEGLNSGKKIEKLIKDTCCKKQITNIKQIKKALLIPSVDLHTGRIYLFCSKQMRGKLLDNMVYINDIAIGKAVRASCSYPGVFSPCKYGQTELIDGGIRENIPWKEAKRLGAEKVISVTFEGYIKEECENLVDVITNSIDILCHELYNYEIQGADYILKIKAPNVSLLDVSKMEELFQLGYTQTKQKIKEIQKLKDAK